MRYTLASGPFVTAWRGPQRLVLAVDGEQVADVQYRDGYNERGCAARLTRLDLDEAMGLVGRICGTCAHAHTLAFCQALEALLAVEVPVRAQLLRCAAAELERLASHLGTLTELYAAMGLERSVATLREIRGTARQAMQLLSGRPALPDLCVPGGVTRVPSDQAHSDLLLALPKLSRRLFQLADGTIDRRHILARTVEVGTMAREAAGQLGLRGPMARACGIAEDARADQPYAAYDLLTVRAVTQADGDVYARLVVLLLEALESVKLVEQALQEMPGGPYEAELPTQMPTGVAEAVVEAPRGLLRYRLESDGRRLSKVAIDPPRPLDRLTARVLLSGALVDNIALIVLSADHCPACAEC